MTETIIWKIFYTLCLLALVISPAFGATESTSSALAGSLAVTKTAVEPSVLMRDDTGIVTLTVTNTGDTSVTIVGAELFAKEFTVLSYQTYISAMTIGPGNSMDLTFTIQGDTSDGVYYAKLYLDLGDETVRYYVPIEIESTPIDISILNRPDTFSEGVKDEITLVVGNLRDNTLSGITITPSGSGIETTQTKVFIGGLESGKKAEVTFEVTPLQEGNITFLVEYRNGINSHGETITIPVQYGDNKLAANLMMNNIEFSSSGTTYTLSADVTNAGLTDANSIVVTVGSPAQPTDPNPVYIVGTLEPDDFSSFELTFTTTPGTSSIPVILQYKDVDGNTFEKMLTVNLGATVGLSNNSTTGSSSGNPSMAGSPQGIGGQVRGGGMFGGIGNGFGMIPFVQIGIIIVAAIGLVVAWRKGYLGKIRSRLRR